jgi:hypothetical protein
MIVNYSTISFCARFTDLILLTRITRDDMDSRQNVSPAFARQSPFKNLCPRRQEKSVTKKSPSSTSAVTFAGTDS